MTIDSPQRQLQDACAALDRAIRSGHEARVETWFQACPALASDDDLALELIYSEFVTREALGPVPRPDEYYRRFPNWADRLRRLFEVDELLKPAGTGTHADDDTATDTHKPLANNSPRRVGQFELYDKLGGGGMGVVYRARQAKPSREVAIKLLRAGSEAGATERARFHREAEAIARLQHPNIVGIYEVGEVDGQPYLAMEFVRGGDLHAYLNGRPQPPEWTAELIATLAKAVHFAHEQGIVHRDIKPGNILLTGDEPKLTDFGLAALNDTSEGLTRTGQVLGTLAYLAPEQAAASLDATLPSVDVYALGAVLYECLTGRPPFVADAEAMTLNMILHADPVPPRKLNPGVPRDLETIALACLAKSPLKRYRTAQTLAEDLARYQMNQPILARPTGPMERLAKWARRRPAFAATAAAAVVSLLVIGGLVASYTSRLQDTLKDVDAQRQRAETQETATQQALDAEAKRREQALAALEKLTDQLSDGVIGSSRDVLDQSKQLEQTLATYLAMAAEAGSSPAQRRVAAGALRQAAGIQRTQGRSKESLKLYGEVEAIMRELIAGQPGEIEYREFLARMLQVRSSQHLFHKNHHLAYDDARAAADLVAGMPDYGTPTGKAWAARAWNVAIVAARRAGMVAAGDEAEKNAEAIWRSLHEQFPDNPDYRIGYSGAHQTRAVDFERHGQHAEAEASYRKASEIRLGGSSIVHRDARFHQADCHRAIALLCEKRGDLKEALKEHRAALTLWDELHADRRNNVIFMRNFSETLRAVAKLSNKPEDSEIYFQKARSYMTTAAVDAYHEIVMVLAALLVDRADHQYLQGKYADAAIHYSTAIAGLTELLGRMPNVKDGRIRLRRTQEALARTFNAWGRYDQALELWDLAFKEVKTPSAHNRLDRAKALAGARRIDEALQAANEVDLKNDPRMALKMAAIYSLAAFESEGPARTTYADEALVWLKQAHAGGVLDDPVYHGYVAKNRDWRILAPRADFQKFLEPKK